MSATIQVTTFDNEPMLINFSFRRMTDSEFENFCHRNPDKRIELSKEGKIIVMPPTHTETGRKNFKLLLSFGNWAESDKTGQCFESSTGFTFPNGAKRSPDLAWVRNEKWNALSEKEKRSFAPLVPDFMVELRSDTDSLKTLQNKMKEYIENGVSLGWLIDTLKRKIYLYRPAQKVEILDNPPTVSGESLLPGFVLDLAEIWD